MSDFQARMAALSPDKRALFERLLQQRSPGPGMTPGNAAVPSAASSPSAGAPPLAGAASAPYVAPATAIEKILVSTWEEVLAVPRVGLHDNFFELGGDSIHCIQIVAKARHAGLDLSNQQVFEFPTVASLAPRVRPRADVSASQEPVIGPVPLTPIQRWLFERSLSRPEHWNQAVLLEMPAALSVAALRAAGDAVVAHHDALRLRFERNEQEAGGWRQVCAAPEPVWLDEHDLSAMPPEAQPDAIERLCAAAQAGFDLAAGPLFCLLFFRLADGQPSRLLLLAHHLIVDGVSFRIVIEDLQRALDQCVAGREPLLPLKTSSFRDWSEHALRKAIASETESELAHWTGLRAQPPLPTDQDLGPNLESSAEHASLTLDAIQTRALVRATAAAGVSVLHAVLAGLLQACHDVLGRDELLIDLEGHGRDAEAGAPDVSRTVGWFTSIDPVTLAFARTPSVDASWPALVCAVRDELQPTVTRAGRFGLLRYAGSAAARARLARVPRPEVMVNYLGQFGQLESGTAFRLARERSGPLFAPEDPRPHLWQLFGGVFSGELRLQCAYSRNRHRADTMDRLMARLAAALQEIAAGDDGSGRRSTATREPEVPADPDVSADDLARITAAHEA
jgi:non-ribosomal peptide synthase protein (TIGR01720 family)